MTYWQFHLVFILPLIGLLALWAWRDAARGRPFTGSLGGTARQGLVYLALIAGIALVYTAPWDNLLVAQGVWGYGEGRVIATLGYVPLEEYLFFVFQPLLTGLWLYGLARRGAEHQGAPLSGTAIRLGGSLALLLISAVGVLALRSEATTYLGLILVWAGPIVALQWGVGGDLLWQRRRVVVPAVALSTLYLWVVDGIAIAWGIWWISPDHTLGLAAFGLPLEEAVFFLLTNLLVVFGLTLALQPVAWLRLRRLGRLLRAWWRGALVLWAVSMIPTPLIPEAFPLLASVSTALLALGTLGYALMRYGRVALGLFAVAFTFGVLIEWIGYTTGLPFGAYQYTAPGPAILGVPLLVPLGWWAFTLIALLISPAPYRQWLAPLALVAWDLGLDPLMVAKGFWAFDAGGFYYGVPLSNFFGWYLAGWLLVALLCRLQPRLRHESSLELTVVFVGQIFFITIGLTFFGLYGAAVVVLVAMGLFVLPRLRGWQRERWTLA